MLGVASTGESIAVLQGVQASSLTESSFAAVLDVSNPDEVMALIEREGESAFKCAFPMAYFSFGKLPGSRPSDLIYSRAFLLRR